MPRVRWSGDSLCVGQSRPPPSRKKWRVIVANLYGIRAKTTMNNRSRSVSDGACSSLSARRAAAQNAAPCDRHQSSSFATVMRDGALASARVKKIVHRDNSGPAENYLQALVDKAISEASGRLQIPDELFYLHSARWRQRDRKDEP